MTPDLFRGYARYNAWMNGNIYRGCAGIPDADRKKDMGAFFKSIHATLHHIIAADRAWMARFKAAPVPSMTGAVIDSYDELWAMRRALDTEIAAFAAAVTGEWLAKPFTFTSQLYQQTFTHPAWLLVLHMFNHQTHHRGQVTTLMKQLGVDPGPTDMPVMPDA